MGKEMRVSLRSQDDAKRCRYKVPIDLLHFFAMEVCLLLVIWLDATRFDAGKGGEGRLDILIPIPSSLSSSIHA